MTQHAGRAGHKGATGATAIAPTSERTATKILAAQIDDQAIRHAEVPQRSACERLAVGIERIDPPDVRLSRHQGRARLAGTVLPQVDARARPPRRRHRGAVLAQVDIGCASKRADTPDERQASGRFDQGAIRRQRCARSRRSGAPRIRGDLCRSEHTTVHAHLGDGTREVSTPRTAIPARSDTQTGRTGDLPRAGRRQRDRLTINIGEATTAVAGDRHVMPTTKRHQRGGNVQVTPLRHHCGRILARRHADPGLHAGGWWHRRQHLTGQAYLVGKRQRRGTRLDERHGTTTTGHCTFIVQTSAQHAAIRPRTQPRLLERSRIGRPHVDLLVGSQGIGRTIDQQRVGDRDGITPVPLALATDLGDLQRVEVVVVDS